MSPGTLSPTTRISATKSRYRRLPGRGSQLALRQSLASVPAAATPGRPERPGVTGVLASCHAWLGWPLAHLPMTNRSGIEKRRSLSRT
jgi:hypothetical protein